MDARSGCGTAHGLEDECRNRYGLIQPFTARFAPDSRVLPGLPSRCIPRTRATRVSFPLKRPLVRHARGNGSPSHPGHVPCPMARDTVLTPARFAGTTAL